MIEIESQIRRVNRNKTQIEVNFSHLNRLTVLNAELIKKSLMKVIEKPYTKLIINLETINFIDSTAFDVLNHLSRVAKRYSSIIELCQVQQPVIELIELVRKYSVFDIKRVFPILNNEKVA